MNRFRDYAGFAIWFVGLGYIVMWPLTMSDFGHAASSAAICGDGGARLGPLCDSAQALMLPPALHLVGLLASAFVTARLLLAIKLPLRKRNSAAGTGIMDVVPRRSRRQPVRSLTKVKPRAHFGLRGPPP
jgi:hypothetical protein